MNTTILNKDGVKFSRIKKNYYTLEFTIENPHLVLSKIIDFSLFKLIHDLNPDIYDKIEIQPINEKEANIALLMKHLFEDLGVTQKFSFIHMQKFCQTDKIIFIAASIKDCRPQGIPEDAELTSIQDLNCICYLLTPHKINFSLSIILDPQMVVDPLLEKIFVNILYKIFKRVKQFIENARV